MVLVCICVACTSVVSGVSLYKRIFGYFQERRIPDDSVSDLADLRRLFEFCNFSFELNTEL